MIDKVEEPHFRTSFTKAMIGVDIIIRQNLGKGSITVSKVSSKSEHFFLQNSGKVLEIH